MKTLDEALETARLRMAESKAELQLAEKRLEARVRELRKEIVGEADALHAADWNRYYRLAVLKSWRDPDFAAFGDDELFNKSVRDHAPGKLYGELTFEKPWLGHDPRSPSDFQNRHDRKKARKRGR